MVNLPEDPDPVRDALAYAEAASLEWYSWPTGEALRRLRIRFGVKKKELAARARVSPSLIGRAEKGADVRMSTLRKLYEALGCRPVILPHGALYDLDWRQAHRDNGAIDWLRVAAPYLEAARKRAAEKPSG